MTPSRLRAFFASNRDRETVARMLGYRSRNSLRQVEEGRATLPSNKALWLSRYVWLREQHGREVTAWLDANPAPARGGGRHAMRTATPTALPYAPVTPERLRAHLSATRERQVLTQRLGYASENSLRHFEAGRNALPPDVVAWLGGYVELRERQGGELAAWLADNPPPAGEVE